MKVSWKKKTVCYTFGHLFCRKLQRQGDDAQMYANGSPGYNHKIQQITHFIREFESVVFLRRLNETKAKAMPKQKFTDICRFF